MNNEGADWTKKPKERAMTEILQKNQIDFEFQQKQFLMMGGSIKTVKEKLSQAEIEKMKKNYVGMYYALTSINWGQGMTLGMAWQKALEQMDAFVASKVKIRNHPANQELLNYHKEFRRHQSKFIMTNEYADMKLTENLKKPFLDYGTKRLNETKSALDEMYKAHMPEQQLQTAPVAKQFDIAKNKTQQLMQQILIQQMTNQRAA